MASCILDNSTINTSAFGDNIGNSVTLSMENVILNLYEMNQNTINLLHYLSLPAPSISTVDDQKIILNFDGTQGSTNFIDEASNITIFSIESEIDTTWKKFGTGSLSCIIGEANGGVYCNIPTIPEFTIHYFFKISSLATNINETAAFTLNGDCSISFSVVGSEFPYLEEIDGYTDQPLPIGIFSIRYWDSELGDVYLIFYICNIDLDAEYHVAITEDDNKISIFINGIKQSFTYQIPENFTIYYQNSLFVELYTNIDAYELTTDILWTENFTIPTSAPYFHGNPEEYELSENASILYLSNTESLMFADEINIYGSCSISGPPYSALPNSVTVGDINIFNMTGETSQYYFLNSLSSKNAPLIISGDFTDSIGNNKLLLDAVYLSKTSGLVSLNKTKLKDCVASGGAEFNASVSRSNIDGGGNVGWIFTGESGFIPKIVMIF